MVLILLQSAGVISWSFLGPAELPLTSSGALRPGATPAKRSSSVTSVGPTRLWARRNSSTGWMSRITSGGRPNQNVEVGSTWVACAFSASAAHMR